MTDFDSLLNAEIVESGRVPSPKVVARARTLGNVLENHYSDRNTLTPVVSPNDDEVSWNGEIGDEEGRGFKLIIRVREDDQEVEEELIVWHKPDDIFIKVKGILAVKDFEYALNRDKEYTYLDAKIED